MQIPLAKFATALSAITSSDSFALLSVSTIYEYESGKKTEKIIGTRYSVADPETFDKFDVKVMNPKPLLSQEQLEATDTRVWVEFSNALVKPFKVEYGSAFCSITADSVQLVKE